jgi:hypothetical protein
MNPRHLPGQIIALAAFAGFVGYFSHAPAYQHRPPEVAVVKLSLTHPGQRLADCHRRTPEELARLAPNMRAKMDCPRGRHSVSIALEVDGRPLYAVTANPAGITSDGAARIYERFDIPAGPHRFVVRMNDGLEHRAEHLATLVPQQVFVVGFDEEDGHFSFR